MYEHFKLRPTDGLVRRNGLFVRRDKISERISLGLGYIYKLEKYRLAAPVLFNGTENRNLASKNILFIHRGIHVSNLVNK